MVPSFSSAAILLLLFLASFASSTNFTYIGPATTPSHTAITDTVIVTILFHCPYVSGANRLESQPLHIIQPNDNMTSITVQFDNLVTYQEIAAASNISNPDLVKIGKELWIPLCRFSSWHQFVIGVVLKKREAVSKSS
uniref:LysM domain-containing protein n=1 Tax=Oryza nivara TaxID=4536 RepID=A0A0E0J2Y6_ORYNI